MEASGPLVARWRTLERAPVEAGTLQHATVEAENAGSATWRTRGSEEGLFLAFHWLAVRGPIPPGRYKLAVDLVEEHRFWLAELGNAAYSEDVDVLPREAGAAHA